MIASPVFAVWGNFGGLAKVGDGDGILFPDTVLVHQDFTEANATNGRYTPDLSENGSNTGRQGTASLIAGWLATNGTTVVDFDGLDDYYLVADDPSLDFTGVTPFSVSAWCWLPTIDRGSCIAYKGNASISSRQWAFQWDPSSSGELVFHVYSGTASHQIGRSFSTFGTTPNAWHFVVGVYDGLGTASTNCHIYLDGIKRDTTDETVGTFTGIVDSAESVWVGRLGTTAYPYLGKMTELKIWDKALSSNEQWTVYTEGTNTWK